MLQLASPQEESSLSDVVDWFNVECPQLQLGGDQHTQLGLGTEGDLTSLGLPCEWPWRAADMEHE